MLTIDDLQWGDADSAGLLSRSWRCPRRPPLLVVAAYRSEEATRSPILREIAGLAALRVDLSPLSAHETEELARALLPAGAASAGRARAISREAGGVPFFVGELARFSGGVAAGQEPSLERLVGMRLERLPEEARRLLELCAVAGRPTAQHVLFEALGSAEPHAALRVLRTESLIRSEGLLDTDVVEAYHNRIREGAIAALDAATLRHHHRRLRRRARSRGRGRRGPGRAHPGRRGSRPRGAPSCWPPPRRRPACWPSTARRSSTRARSSWTRRPAAAAIRRLTDALRVKLGDALEQCGQRSRGGAGLPPGGGSRRAGGGARSPPARGRAAPHQRPHRRGPRGARRGAPRRRDEDPAEPPTAPWSRSSPGSPSSGCAASASRSAPRPTSTAPTWHASTPASPPPPG